MGKKTTFGLSLDKISRLLRLTLGDRSTQDEKPGDQDPGAVLRQFLSRELPLDPVTPDSLPAVLKRPCHELAVMAGKTIGDLLFDPTTDTLVLRALKDYCKALPKHFGTETWQAVATAVYYASIANGLLFHRIKITELSSQRLGEGFEKLQEKPWVTDELKDLFRRAQAACQERESERS